MTQDTIPSDTSFIHTYQVGDKSILLDALLVFAELAMSEAGENPTKEQMIQAVKSAIRPQSLKDTLTNAEAFALSVRVSIHLRALGKDTAP